MTPEARAWLDVAVLELRRAGFRRLPDGPYWLGVSLVLETGPPELDIDNAIQPVLNALKTALGVDDRYVGALSATKVLVSSPDGGRVHVACCVLPLTDRGEFSVYSRGWRHAT
jgi:hypothetical protein